MAFGVSQTPGLHRCEISHRKTRRGLHCIPARRLNPIWIYSGQKSGSGAYSGTKRSTPRLIPTLPLHTLCSCRERLLGCGHNLRADELSALISSLTLSCPTNGLSITARSRDRAVSFRTWHRSITRWMCPLILCSIEINTPIMT